MKHHFLQMKIVKSILFCAAFGIFFSTFVLKAQGQTVTFAQFIRRGTGQDFVFTNNTSNATFNTISGGAPVRFEYQVVTGILDPSLMDLQNAHLTITAPTTAQATLGSGSSLVQPFNQPITITILRDTPTDPGVGTGTRRNLLTVTILPSSPLNNPAFSGSGGGGTFDSSTPNQIITFTSDFVNFSMTTERNASLSFSSVSPSLTLDGNFLANFNAAGSGTFASNPPPTVNVVTAAAATVGGRVTEANGRAIFRARVTLIDSQGLERTVYTNTQGYYNFADVAGGQTYIFSVAHRRYQFAVSSLVEFVDEDDSSINFVSSGERLLAPANRLLDW